MQKHFCTVFAFQFANHKNSSLNGGLIVGVKLPTGKINVANAEGEIAERRLQPGSGTTDLIVGGYYAYAALRDDSSWFTQVLLHTALNQHDGFKPGQKFHFDVGYRYQAAPSLGLLLQTNFTAKGKDSGVNAEPDDSGSRMLSLSPGITGEVFPPATRTIPES